MSHPSIENRPNPLYVKAMLLHIYVLAVLPDLPDEVRRGLSDQLSRSSRSIKNNVNEAQSAESRRDFVHKLKIADKELHETTGMIATEAKAFPLLTLYQALLLDLCEELAKLSSMSIT
ncbi:MAG: four helix bundle protein [Ignavibacteriae bacterium]|nr:MAG: four helix bundle protein [Ignavibacteriota bacterium]